MGLLVSVPVSHVSRQFPTCCEGSWAEVAFVRFPSTVHVLVVLKSGAGFESSLADIAHKRALIAVGLHVPPQKISLLCCIAANIAVMTSSLSS